jgi:16S rRNA (cytosine1402-N4)-methyltransferase
LRVFVNDELDQIDEGLEQLLPYLSVGGRLVVVTFHSLEAKIVTRVLARHRKTRHKDTAHDSESTAEGEGLSPPVHLQTLQKLVLPTQAEVEANPRSRSAQLRVAARVI